MSKINKVLLLINQYYEVFNTIENLSTETILYWQKILKIQEASGKDVITFCRIQKEFFEKHKISIDCKFALTNLTSDQCFKRAKYYGEKENIEIDSNITNMDGYRAKKIFDECKDKYYPFDNTKITGNLDTWKRVVYYSNKSNENINNYIESQFIWCKKKKLKVPFPTILASEEGIKRSLVTNKTIL